MQDEIDDTIERKTQSGSDLVMDENSMIEKPVPRDSNTERWGNDNWSDGDAVTDRNNVAQKKGYDHDTMNDISNS